MQQVSKAEIATIKAWLGTGSVNIFGRQYAGKDTQCKKLAQIFDGVFMSGGEILRSSQTAQHIRSTITTGELSPTDEYRAIITPYLSRKEFARHPLFLSSFGRMKGEEDAILAATKQSGHETKAVVFLDIDEATTWQRFRERTRRGTRQDRADDTEEALAKRLHLYEIYTMPVIERYRELGLLISVDGAQSIEQVDTAILRALLERAQKAS